MADIGIVMRPEVFRKKRNGSRAFWHFKGGLPEGVHTGDHLWVCLTDKWSGYFTIDELGSETWEVAWNPASWMDAEYPMDYGAGESLSRGGQYTTLVPGLPLPSPCSKCGGPVRMEPMPYEHERVPDERVCCECGQREEHCVCRANRRS